MASGGSTKAVVAALLGNLTIASFKYFAAYVSGSSSMLAEGHHSLADSTNQVLLLFGLNRSRQGPTGEGLKPRTVERTRSSVQADPNVKQVADVRTMVLGADAALVAVDVVFEMRAPATREVVERTAAS